MTIWCTIVWSDPDPGNNSDTANLIRTRTDPDKQPLIMVIQKSAAFSWSAHSPQQPVFLWTSTGTCGNCGGYPKASISLLILSAQALMGIPVTWNPKGNRHFLPYKYDKVTNKGYNYCTTKNIDSTVNLRLINEQKWKNMLAITISSIGGFFFSHRDKILRNTGNYLDPSWKKLLGPVPKTSWSGSTSFRLRL